MITRTFSSIAHLNKLTPAFFSTHHEPIPTKLPKVQSVLINLYVRNRRGFVEKVPAFVGESLLEAISRMKVHAYREDVCNGYDLTYRPHYRPHDADTKGPICGSCRVVLEDNWFQRVNQETDGLNDNEEYLLKATAVDMKSNTRLACCVPVESWMEGLTCTVDVDPLEGEVSVIT